jgi:hypothetical protein
VALSRRSFLKRAAGAAGALAVAPLATQAADAAVIESPKPVAPPVVKETLTVIVEDFDREHEAILRDAMTQDPALLMALVRHSLISRESAMAMMFGAD